MKRLTIFVLTIFVLTASCKPPVPPISPISPIAVPALHVLLDGEPTSELRNPGLERPYTVRGMSMTAAQGWGIWWLDAPLCQPGRADCDIPCPSNCDVCKKADQGCYWATPEFAESWYQSEPNRVKQGNSAQKYFTYGRMGQEGLLQQVRIGTGKQVSFSAWMQGWQCFQYANCNGGYKSDLPYRLHLKVGIDPLGGTDPFTSTVIWSAEGESFDDWAQFVVTATSQADIITVFTHARAEFDFRRENNNVNIDGAALRIITEPPPITYTHHVFLPNVFSNEIRTPPKAHHAYILIHPDRVTPGWEAAIAATAWTLTTDKNVLDDSGNFVVVVHPEDFGLLVYEPELRVMGHVAGSHAVMANTPNELLAILRGG